MKNLALNDPAALLAKVNILIVETDQHVSDMLYSVLIGLGFKNVYVASDGYQAVKEMHTHKMDLVITDRDISAFNKDLVAELKDTPYAQAAYWTPVEPKDGASFVRFVRGSKHSPNPYISIIMLTTQALYNHITYARDSGVNEILLKPVSAEGLCNRITRVVEKQPLFITSQSYKGPCRRHTKTLQPEQEDRRKRDVQIIRFEEYKRA